MNLVRIGKMERENKTNYPSIDMPWNYNRDIKNVEIPNFNAYDYFKFITEYHNNWQGIAIEWLDFKMTYQEFREYVDLYAKSYISIGVKKGDIVPVISESYPHFMISLMALSKIGAIQTNLDKNISENDLKKYLDEFHVKNIVVYSKHLSKITNAIEGKVNKVIVTQPSDFMNNYQNISDETGTILENENIALEENEKYIKWNGIFKDHGKEMEDKEMPCIDGNYPLFIGFTSGTTGDAKPVVLSSKNMIAMAIKIATTLNIEYGNNKKSLHFVPENYPYGFVNGNIMMLLMGKNVVLPTNLDYFKNLHEYFMRNLSYLQGIPPIYEAIRCNPIINEMDLSTIEMAFSGGDAMNKTVKDLNNKFLAQHNSTAFIRDGLGNAEGTSAIMVEDCQNIEQYNSESVGRPLIGNNVRIINPETSDINDELKCGEIGLFCFTSETLMLGYYNDTEATNKVIKTDKNGIRWFVTDTLMHIDEKGYGYADGRIRRFFITITDDGKAFKVYTDNIQKVIIENFPNDILNVGVVKKSDSKRSFIPKAYLVLKNDKPLTTELINEIIKTCSKNLPSYAIPVEFEQIDQLPLTTAKKTDYNQLEKIANEYTNDKKLERKL